MTSLGADETGFVKKSFKNSDGSESPYVVYVPQKYDPAKPAPIMLFLHGAGESKGGTKMPVEQGIANGHIQKRAKDFPAIVVIPQAEEVKVAYADRWLPKNPDGKRAIAMLETTMKEYKVDEKRVYLTGLSMGGYGAWAMAAEYPDRWAAIVPICGGADPAIAEKIKNIPCWAFHGESDAVVKPELSRKLIDALKAAGGKPRYTEMAWVGHNSWDPAYSVDELYTWMFAQKKK
jgi:predicted peptidase